MADTVDMRLTKAAREYLSSLGRKGGAARAKKLTPAQRKSQASKAAKVRWSKKAVDRKG